MEDDILAIRAWWKNNWHEIFECPIAYSCCTPIRHVVNPQAETIPNYPDEVCKTDEHKKCIYYMEFESFVKKSRGDASSSSKK